MFILWQLSYCPYGNDNSKNEDEGGFRFRQRKL